MSWQTETVEILRVLIDDLDTIDPTYDDDRLERILLVAAFQVNNRLSFDTEYTVDIQTTTLTPDPTDNDIRDDSFVNLMCLKAACLIDRGKATTAADAAVSVKEFSTAINLSAVAAARQKLVEKGGWCAVFEEEAMNHQLAANGVPGLAVLGPFRTMQGYTGFNPYETGDE